MINEITNLLTAFKERNDFKNHGELLKIAELFISSFSDGISNHEELDLGVNLLRELFKLQTPHENEYDLKKNIKYSKIKIFKLCIPKSHAELRGLTELLLGMPENKLG